MNIPAHLPLPACEPMKDEGLLGIQELLIHIFPQQPRKYQLRKRYGMTGIDAIPFICAIAWKSACSSRDKSNAWLSLSFPENYLNVKIEVPVVGL
jgi:hypothetical protein